MIMFFSFDVFSYPFDATQGTWRSGGKDRTSYTRLGVTTSEIVEPAIMNESEFKIQRVHQECSRLSDQWVHMLIGTRDG